MKRFQNQCFFQTRSVISSIGTPLVSGSKKITNTNMIVIHAAKKKKIPARMRHIMDRNACAMMKVKSMFELTAKAYPAVLVSRGKVSLGMSHPSGPHDHANPEMKKQMRKTTAKERSLSSSLVELSLTARMDPMQTWEMNICTQASRRSALLPTLSTRTMETTVLATLRAPIMREDSREALLLKPMAWKSTGA